MSTKNLLHVLESLGDLLDLGRRAEALAKDRDRDGLAVLARLRSTREHAWRGRWPDEPVEALGEKLMLPPWLEPHREQLQASLQPFEVRVLEQDLA